MAEDFGSATTSAAIQGYKRRAESVGAMPALDPTLGLLRGSSLPVGLRPDARVSNPMRHSTGGRDPAA